MSQVLVIIGAPPSSTSKFSAVGRLFANGTRNYHGPPCPKPSKAQTTVKQRGHSATTHKAHPEVISINSQSLTPLGPPQHSTRSHRPQIAIPDDCNDVHDMGNIGTNEDDNVKHCVVLSSSPPPPPPHSPPHPPMLLKRRTVATPPSSRLGLPPLPLQDYLSKRKSVGLSQGQRRYL